MTLSADDPTALSQLFHLNSEPWLDTRAYNAPYQQRSTCYLDAERTALPPPTEDGIVALAAARRSHRRFADRALSLDALGRLLHAGYGVVGAAPMPESEGRFLRRSVPSAGGLYPLELYPLLRDVETLADGVYHYAAPEAALERLRDGDWTEEAKQAFYAWPYACGANAIVCIAAEFERTQSKYGPRGYRYVLLEAGHAAQNLCLAAAERGLASLCTGGYRDRRLNAMLGLDGSSAGVVYAVAIGHPV